MGHALGLEIAQGDGPQLVRGQVMQVRMDAVQPPALDIAVYGVRHQIPAPACGKGLPHLGGGQVDNLPVGDDGHSGPVFRLQQPLLGRQILPRLGVGSVKGPDVGQRQNVRRMIPALQGQKHIRPHEKPQLILRMLHAQLAQGVHGVAGAGAVQLRVQGLGLGAQLGTGQGRHFQTVGGVGAALGQGLVGRNAGGDQQQTVQPQGVHSRPGRRQVAPVDGVEGAAVDADLHTLRFLSFSSSIFRLSLLC